MRGPLLIEPLAKARHGWHDPFGHSFVQVLEHIMHTRTEEGRDLLRRFGQLDLGDVPVEVLPRAMAEALDPAVGIRGHRNRLIVLPGEYL
jgi:hypothetical protein